MAADKVKATNNETQGFFNKAVEKQQNAVKWYGDKLVLVEKLKLTSLAIHNKDREVDGKKIEADSTAWKVAKFIGSLIAALPVLLLFGAATLVHKAGTFVRDLFKCSEKKVAEEDTSEKKVTVETTEKSTDTSTAAAKGTGMPVVPPVVLGPDAAPVKA